MKPDADRTVRTLSLCLGISTLTFGVLKFIDPFHAWFGTQIAKSGLPAASFGLGIAGEMAIGLALIAPWAIRKLLEPYRPEILAVSSLGLVVMMLVATYVHLHPDVPAEVLPLKIKPPIIPLSFLGLAVFNLVRIARMDGETDLGKLLASMSPQRRPGSYVFVIAEGNEHGLEVFASVTEAEGLTVVTTAQDADRAQLRYDFRAAWITLEIHSALAAVGLTAAVSSALAHAGISCNIIAGYHHDHLLVPEDRIADALAVLNRLSDAHQDRSASNDSP